jgi:hypothetical protein
MKFPTNILTPDYQLRFMQIWKEAIFNNLGFNSRSGFGDGGYSLYFLHDKAQNIVGAKIIFIDEEEEEWEDS